MIPELSTGAYMSKNGTFSQHTQDVNDKGLNNKLHNSPHDLLTVIMILDEVGVWVWKIMEKGLVDLVIFHMGFDPKVQLIDSGTSSL